MLFGEEIVVNKDNYLIFVYDDEVSTDFDETKELTSIYLKFDDKFVDEIYNEKNKHSIHLLKTWLLKQYGETIINITDYDLIVPSSLFRKDLKLNLSTNSIFEDLKATKIIIPNSVSYIGDNCLRNCKTIKEVIIPNSVVNINTGCFESCQALKEINIPDSVDFLWNECFVNCNSLIEITIPSLITNINAHCFHGCTSLSNIILPTTLKELNVKCFYNCKSLSEITIPKTVTYISKTSFKGCDSLTNIIMNSF